MTMDEEDEDEDAVDECEETEESDDNDEDDSVVVIEGPAADVEGPAWLL
jgi:hypothetical protein